MKRWIAVAAVGVVALAGTFVVVQTASAAKPGGEVIMVTCGADTVEVTANGNGKFGTARINETGEIFVVTSFSDVHGTFTDNEDNVFEFEDPDVSHPAPPNRDVLECHFVATFEDEFGHGEAEGDVTGFIAGKR